MELKSKRSRRRVLKKTSAIIECVDDLGENSCLPDRHSLDGIRRNWQKAKPMPTIVPFSAAPVVNTIAVRLWRNAVSGVIEQDPKRSRRTVVIT